MGDRKRNIVVNLSAAQPVGKRRMKLPVKRRSQVSLQTRPPLPRPQLPKPRMAIDANLEEGEYSNDDVEIVPHNCVLTELSSGSDTDASDRDEEKVAPGYLGDCEMESKEPRKRAKVGRLGVPRIQPRLKASNV